MVFNSNNIGSNAATAHAESRESFHTKPAGTVILWSSLPAYEYRQLSK